MFLTFVCSYKPRQMERTALLHVLPAPGEGVQTHTCLRRIGK